MFLYRRNPLVKKPLFAVAFSTLAIALASPISQTALAQNTAPVPPVLATVPLPNAPRPNIIVIVADDLGYNDLSIHGSREIPTPNIDSLGVNGIRFSNGYVSAPQCAPTRAGLLTGRYQQRFGFEFNAIRSSNNGGLPLDQTTIADHLKAAGYATGLVGKWHLGSLPEQRPQSRGFQEFFGFLGGANPYLPPALSSQLKLDTGTTEPQPSKRQAREAARQAKAAEAEAATGVTTAVDGAKERAAQRAERLARRAQNEGKGGEDEGPIRNARRQSPDIVPNILRGDVPVAEREYLTDAFGREASAYIERHQQTPFYLQITFNAPHGPQQATQKYLDRFAHIQNPTRRTYAAQVSALDDAVGRVLQTLRATKQEDNTLIFFFSDNGGPLGDKWNGSSNVPLRGEKGDVFEGGIRVPFLVQWKGHLPAGKVDARPVIQLDVLPTALAVAGAPVPPTQAPDSTVPAAIDGVNLLPYLDGTNTGTPHDVLYWRFFRGRTPEQFRWAIRQGNTKLLKDSDSQPQLVNLANDLEEVRDLSPEQAAQRNALQEKWDRWNAQLQEPAWQIGRNKEFREAQKAAEAPTAATPEKPLDAKKEGKRQLKRDARPLSPKKEAKRAARRTERQQQEIANPVGR